MIATPYVLWQGSKRNPAFEQYLFEYVAMQRIAVFGVAKRRRNGT